MNRLFTNGLSFRGLDIGRMGIFLKTFGRTGKVGIHILIINQVCLVALVEVVALVEEVVVPVEEAA